MIAYVYDPLLSPAYPGVLLTKLINHFMRSLKALASVLLFFLSETGAFVIVTPGSMMYNWKEELETWGHFKTGLFHGNTKEGTLQRALRGRLDVVLTTYETMRNHLVSCATKPNKNNKGKISNDPQRETS